MRSMFYEKVDYKLKKLKTNKLPHKFLVDAC